MSINSYRMDEFIKSEVSYLFFKELDKVQKIFNEPFRAYLVSGKDVTEFDDEIDGKIVDAFFEELEKIKLTTTNKEKAQYMELYLEIREKTLEFLSKIPLNSEISKTKYLQNYKKYAEHTQYLELIGIEVKPRILQVCDEDNVFREEKRSPAEMFSEWAREENNFIPCFFFNEPIFKGICLFFQTTRKKINAENRYQGINLVKLIKQINIENLAYNLIKEGFVASYQEFTLIKLFSGELHFEAIEWKGNQSELNKFIKSIHASSEYKSKSTIEWKSFSQIFLVEDKVIDSDKLKGASPAKVDNPINLQPFLNIVKSSIIK